MNALATIAPPATNVDAYRLSTDAAAICKDIVVKTAKAIGPRKYVCVEGWQAIAIAHGCAASSRDVDRVEGGIRAVGEVRRMSDGALIAQAEGFVGEDEPTWYGGETVSYGKTKSMPKRADYAIRAMAQTRAISRACRSAFAHVVVMMDAGLATTPAEEVPAGGFDDHGPELIPAPTRQNVQPIRTVENVTTITDAQRSVLIDLARGAGIDAVTLNEKCKIAKLPDLPAAQFEAVKAWLTSKLPAQHAPEPAGADILDDDLPY